MAQIDSRLAPPEAPARQTIAVGSIGTVVGVALGAVGLDRWAAAVTLASFVVLLWGLHRFGRLGPDAPRAHAAGADPRERTGADPEL